LFGRRVATSFFDLKRSTESVRALFPLVRRVFATFPSKRPFVLNVRFEPGKAEKTLALDASTLSVHYNPEITTNNAPRRKKRLFFHIFLKRPFFCQITQIRRLRQNKRRSSPTNAFPAKRPI
jgi:hypothetical protein